jgi:hypothetical protein
MPEIRYPGTAVQKHGSDADNVGISGRKRETYSGKGRLVS